MNNDKLIIGGHEFNSRFILGSGKFSMDMTKSVIENAGVEMATIAVRRVTREAATVLLIISPMV